MRQNFDHADHPYRHSDHNVLFIMIATVISAMWVTFWAVISALGSGLASTPTTRVPDAANVLWWIAGYSFFACVVLFMVTLITRRRAFGYLLGLVVLAAGIALTAGHIVNWQENARELPMMRAWEWLGLIIPIVASGIIFWNSRSLLPWGVPPDHDAPSHTHP